MPTSLTDIIAGCKKQDPVYQEQLYRHCYAEQFKTCWRYASGDAQTAGALFNEAMFKVFHGLEQFKNDGEFMGWVRRIIVNTCIDHCRKNVRFKTVGEDKAHEAVLPVIPEVYDRLNAHEILSLVYQLPKNSGFVFNLFVLEGYKHEEIAKILGISVGTSKWHLNEARRLLKLKLEEVFTKENLADAI